MTGHRVRGAVKSTAKPGGLETVSRKLQCLTCGAITDQSRCRLHRTKQARGYGAPHEASKKAAMRVAPYCWNCGCGDCALQWHHVTELRGGRNLEKDDRRQLLCKKCHNAVKETS